MQCTGVRSVEGEAVVNNRKNKVIASYELAVVLGWEGAVEGSASVTGGQEQLRAGAVEN